MAIKKPTKRKAFNFLRSYFDVLNELGNDKDRLNFLMSIINKQFLDEDPKKLNFITNLCYESQRHAIEQSVKGWKRACNTDTMTTPPTTPPTPKQEEEVEEKGEVEEKEKYYKCFNHLKLKQSEFDKLNILYTKQQIDSVLESIENYKKNTNYISLYLTAKKWLAKENKNVETKTEKIQL